MTIEIRSSVVLPAQRENIELHTSDGLTLVGELSLPLVAPPVATLVCLHPLPTAGGFMDSHIIRKAAARLPALADVAVLRFNFRGVHSPRGTSEGEFGECSYKTTFRRSVRITDWSKAKRQVLVDTKKSGLCGPGGADLGVGASGEPLLFFHAWTCPELGTNCPGGTVVARTAPVAESSMRMARRVAQERYCMRNSGSEFPHHAVRQ